MTAHLLPWVGGRSSLWSDVWPRRCPISTAAGYVHRDLKPANVVVDGRDLPILLDFGIIGRMATGSREHLDVAGQVMGSVDYMAPEQALGELVDARADLFALGCVLYELLSGTLPFPVGTPAETLARRVTEDPIPIRTHIPGLEPDLEELVDRLLRRDPSTRLGHATDVVRALGELGAEPWPGEVPAARVHFYRPRFVGREKTMKDLRQILPGRDGAPMAVLMGESGDGKTRVLMQLATEGVSRGGTVLLGSCLPPNGTPRPLAGLEGPVRAAFDHLSGARASPESAIASLTSVHAQVLAPFVSEIEAEPGTPTGSLSAEAGSTRNLEALRVVFDTLAESRRKLLLVIDDAQWAGDLTLGYLTMVAARADRSRTSIRVVLGCRSEDRRRLRGILSSSEVLHLPLGRLSDAEVTRMAAEMMALEELPGPVARLLSSVSQGSPFQAAEYLRAAVEEGVLCRAGKGSWVLSGPEPSGLPDSIAEVVERRLDRLDDASRRLIEIAALQGREVRPALLALACGRLSWEGSLDGSLQELLARQLLAEGPPLCFEHDRVRESILATVGSNRAPRLHRAAAEAMEELGVEDDRRAELAHHWLGASELGRAAELFLQAGAYELSRFALYEAEAHFRQARAASPEGSAVFHQAGESLVRVLLGQGRFAEARDLALESLEEIRRSGALEHELGFIEGAGSSLLKLGDFDEAMQWLEEGERRSSAPGHEHHRAFFLGCQASIALMRGDGPRAEVLAEGSVDAARRSRSRYRILSELERRGQILMSTGSSDAAAVLDEAVELARGESDLVMEGLLFLRRACLAERLGDAGAEGLFRQALGLTRMTGDRPLELAVLSALANHLDSHGKREAAQPHYQELLKVHRAMGSRNELAESLINAADHEAGAGRLDVARTYFEEAAELGEGLGSDLLLGAALAGMAEVDRLLAQDLEGAHLMLERALDLVVRADPIWRCEIEVRLARNAMARGHDGRRHLDRARRLMMDGGLESSPVAQHVAELELDVEAFEAGAGLVHGCLAQHLPEALKGEP